MHRFELKLLQSAACSAAAIALTAHVFAAPTVTLSVGGQSYNITYTDPSTSYNASTALIQSQPWWGNSSSAQSFATAVGSSLGYPLFNIFGPLFAYEKLTNVGIWAAQNGGGIINTQASSSINFPYATATLASSNISGSGTVYLASNLGSSVNPAFSGGTLQMNVAGGSYNQNFTVDTSTTNTIDQYGNASTFTGVFSDAVAGQAGNIIIANSLTGGKVIFAGNNTYTGFTTINSGASLQIGNGATLGGIVGNVVNNGSLTFDRSDALTYAGAMSGTGLFTKLGVGALTLSGLNSYTGGTTVTAGSLIGDTNSLQGAIINNAAVTFNQATTGTYAGVMSGTGDVVAAGGGTLAFTAANTYTGATNIGSGSTLALSGSGSIAQSSSLTNNGSFDISATTSGATINAITGSGAVALGSKNLTVANASGAFSGLVTGSGILNIFGGNQTFSGSNTGFTGTIQVQSGASLIIPDASALGSSTLALIGSATVPATLTTTATTTIANAITVSGDPVFNVASGTTTTISSPITDGISSGDVVAAGGGTLALTAVNTYTGLTSITAGSTLALSGDGAIALSNSLTNNGNFNITGKTANVSVATYTQGSTGTLAMNVSPSNTQKLLVTGAASLAGGLSLTGSVGTYRPGRYSLLTANGVSGSFGSFSSNLSSLTTLGYSLAYDGSNVYLIFTPNVADTQQSLVNTASALQNTYTLQNSVLANSFSYDCNEFGANGICISVGGRNTAVSAANGLNNTSGLLIAAYRPHQNYRIGAYIDQNLSMNNAGSTVNLGNNTPLIGLFGAWNEKQDGTGTEIKVSAAYGQKNATVTRQVVGTSEPGSGSSQLSSQGAQLIVKYGFGLTENVNVSPYVGVRYTQNNMGGYTEGASSTVTSPLTYSALNTDATTALAGLGASYRVTPVFTTFASAGVETDTNTANGTYSATGLAGLTPINFNANPVKTRPTATLGAYYDIAKYQRLGVTGIYRQEPYQGVSTTTVMATYMIGL
jgi:autotransporter-associated beta strand protein